MSENKNYVSNNEVHSAFGGDSKIKYLKEKIIAICAVLVLIIGGIIFYTTQKQEKPLKAKNDAGLTMEDSAIEEVDSSPITTYDDKENFNADTQNIIKEPQVQNDNTNTNPNPEIEQVAEVVKQKNISTQLRRTPGKNEITWNSELTDAADEIRIVFKDAKGRVWKDELVSGQSSYYYDPGNSQAGGISTEITIIPNIKSKNIKLTGSQKLIGQFFKCS